MLFPALNISISIIIYNLLIYVRINTIIHVFYFLLYRKIIKAFYISCLLIFLQFQYSCIRFFRFIYKIIYYFCIFRHLNLDVDISCHRLYRTIRLKLFCHLKIACFIICSNNCFFLILFKIEINSKCQLSINKYILQALWCPQYIFSCIYHVIHVIFASCIIIML